MKTLQDAVIFRAVGFDVVADDLTDGERTVTVCSLSSEADAHVAVLSLMAVVRATPVTFLPAWKPYTIATTNPGYADTDCDTCETEVSGQ